MPTRYRYPLADHHGDMVRTATGKPLPQVTLDGVQDGRIGSGDMTISGDTLLMQAALAEEAGYPQLANNLRRAAELVLIPAPVVLQTYTALRPHRSSYGELQQLATEMEQQYEAERVAGLIR